MGNGVAAANAPYAVDVENASPATPASALEDDDFQCSSSINRLVHSPKRNKVTGKRGYAAYIPVVGAADISDHVMTPNASDRFNVNRRLSVRVTPHAVRVERALLADKARGFIEQQQKSRAPFSVTATVTGLSKAFRPSAQSSVRDPDFSHIVL